MATKKSSSAAVTPTAGTTIAHCNFNVQASVDANTCEAISALARAAQANAEAIEKAAMALAGNAVSGVCLAA